MDAAHKLSEAKKLFAKWAVSELDDNAFAALMSEALFGVADPATLARDQPRRLMFTGIVTCPNCGTDGLLREDGVVEAKEFHTKAVKCQTCCS